MVFDYKIENDHLNIICVGQTSWHYIGSLRGVTAKIIENAAVAAGGQITIEISFPTGLPERFIVTYNNVTEAGKVLNKSEQLVKDLINYTQQKEKVAHDTRNVMEAVILNLLNRLEIKQ